MFEADNGPSRIGRAEDRNDGGIHRGGDVARAGVVRNHYRCMSDDALELIERHARSLKVEDRCFRGLDDFVKDRPLFRGSADSDEGTEFFNALVCNLCVTFGKPHLGVAVVGAGIEQYKVLTGLRIESSLAQQLVRGFIVFFARKKLHLWIGAHRAEIVGQAQVIVSRWDGDVTFERAAGDEAVGQQHPPAVPGRIQAAAGFSPKL